MCEENPIDPVAAPPGARRAAPRADYRPCDVRQAVRQAVADRCRTLHSPCDTDALADALLVASELTTNAIVHGGGVTDVRIDITGPGIRVSVSDRSDRLPTAEPDPEQRRGSRPGGHGWPIVCRLARDIRVSDLPSGGKCITAVVPLT
ncbi:ATPase [Streptomyces thermospinosisporus]|uniref:ATPase n=1 Tax=Streptomyces thermospinosisporus TaxID=161482 RepID=A0ABP4JWI6_9ACTN